MPGAVPSPPPAAAALAVSTVALQPCSPCSLCSLFAQLMQRPVQKLAVEGQVLANHWVRHVHA